MSAAEAVVRRAVTGHRRADGRQAGVAHHGLVRRAKVAAAKMAARRHRQIVDSVQCLHNGGIVVVVGRRRIV